MTVSEKIKEKIENDEDFVHCPKMSNSIKKIVDKYPDGVSNLYIAKVLMISEKEVEAMYENILVKIRTALKIN
jgi:hypothetical protein